MVGLEGQLLWGGLGSSLEAAPGLEAFLALHLSAPDPVKGWHVGQDRITTLQFIRQSLMLWETVLVVIRKHHITGTSILSPHPLLTSFPSSQGSQPALDILLSLLSQLWDFLLHKPRCEIELLRAEGCCAFLWINCLNA